MSLLTYIAFVFAALSVSRHGPAQAMLRFYLPVLLLLPDTYHAVMSGIPKLSFNQAAVLPVFGAAFLKYATKWKPSIADFLVLFFVCSVSYSEYLAAGYSEAQNLAINMITAALAPYLIARWCIANERLHVPVARCFVVILFGLSLWGVFEAKFGYNPFLATLGPFFPGQGGWVTTFRHGLARVAGPYAHAILAGMMMVIGYRLHRWLQWGGHWEPKFKKINLPWSKPKVITVWLFLGCLMTVARGPWIGGIVGGVFTFIGRSKNKKRMFVIMMSVCMAIGIPTLIAFNKYLEVEPGMPMTQSQESAVYRKVLMDKYTDIALDHAWLGWGRNTWPKVGGMESIDNYYLLLTLMHGLLSMLLLVGIMCWLMVRLLIHGLNEPPGHNSLALCFMGIILSILISLATVYLGENVLPTFFFILGWAEGLLKDPASDPGYAQAAHTSSTAPMRQRFRHIIS